MRPGRTFPPRPPAAGNRTGAFTLVEVLVATTVVMFALSMFVQVVLEVTRAREVAQGDARVGRTATSTVEMRHGQDFFELYALFNEDPSDDPDGPGSAPGAVLRVDGVRPLPGQVAAGRVRFPELPDPDDPGRMQLREDVVDRALGMPRDLDLDGLIDSEDHADDYVILPFALEFRWQTRAGPRSFRMFSMLSEMRL